MGDGTPAGGRLRHVDREAGRADEVDTHSARMSPQHHETLTARVTALGPRQERLDAGLRLRRPVRVASGPSSRSAGARVATPSAIRMRRTSRSCSRSTTTRTGGPCHAGHHFLDVALRECLERLIGLHVDVDRPVGQAVARGNSPRARGTFRGLLGRFLGRSLGHQSDLASRLDRRHRRLHALLTFDSADPNTPARADGLVTCRRHSRSSLGEGRHACHPACPARAAATYHGHHPGTARWVCSGRDERRRDPA